MELGLSRRQLFTMFASVYFVQGVIQAYQLNFFKPHMDSEGIDADRLAIVASLGLVPFIIKWVFGIVSDRYPLFGLGHRVPYMLIGLVSTAVAFGVAFFIDPSESFPVLAAMVLAATFFMALFDTTADALSVDAVEAADHSTVQAWMNGGRAGGLIVVSIGFGLLADAFGYRYIFLVIAVLLLGPLWYVSRVREPDERTPAHTFDRRAFRALLEPRYLVFALVLILAWTFFQGIDGLVTFYMANELGASGRAILLVAPLWGVAVGFQWTNYVTFTMGITDLRIAGSMFAILQTMSNIGIGAGEGIGTALSNDLGFVGVFRSFALANLVAVPLMLFVINRFALSRRVLAS